MSVAETGQFRIQVSEMVRKHREKGDKPEHIELGMIKLFQGVSLVDCFKEVEVTSLSLFLFYFYHKNTYWSMFRKLFFRVLGYYL